MESQGIAVVAVGGNALIKDKAHQTVQDQFNCANDTMKHIVDMIEKGWDVVVTHGNGPQVGFILRRSELARHELHEIPLDYCGADTQGAIGYMFQNSLQNEFNRRGMDKHAATVVTQTVVDKDDPAFQNPTKPIGSFMDESEATRRAENEGWAVVEDAGRGWRRVVPSPIPTRIVEADVIDTLVHSGVTVVGVGGGGIPVVEDGNGQIKGVEAVIDKDFSSALMAANIKADLFIISTAVEKVALNFNTPDEVQLDQMTVAEAKQYVKEGHFAPGSMLPKIQAIIKFFEQGGKKALITDPEHISEALEGKTGTWILP
jgi:carbamate kinase